MTICRKNFVCYVTIFLLLALAFAPALRAGSESTDQIGASGSPARAKTDGYNPAYNDYARFIAGRRTPGSILAPYENEPAWIKYAESMNRSWERYKMRQLEPMKEWASQELHTARTPTVFYPFSGPDFFNLYTLFPGAKTYLLLALEPVGAIPDFSAGDIPDFFADLQRALYEYLYIDYFVIARMKTQIAETELKGVLPILMFFLARENVRVLDVRYWAMRPDGTIEEQPALGGRNFQEAISGVRLVIEGARGAGKQTLYYIRLNLQNNSFGRNPYFISFLKSFGPLTTFTKSASYVLFSPYSSEIRQFILDRSQYVLQDDSGIPWKYFSPEIWKLRLYGTYAGPIDLFKDKYQEDLAMAYQEGKDVYPLPFGIGYQFKAGTSNLLFAAKKTK
jgi:hypothetical protein